MLEARGSTRRRQGRQVPREAALSGSFPPVAESRTGRPDLFQVAGCELEQNSFLRRPSPPHPRPPAPPSRYCVPPVPLSPRPWRKEKGIPIPSTTKLQPKLKKKKKIKNLKRKEIPSPEANSLNRHGKPPNRQICNCGQDSGVRGMGAGRDPPPPTARRPRL